MKWIKTGFLILAAGVVASALTNALGLSGGASFLLGLPFGVVAAAYANHRWKLV